MIPEISYNAINAGISFWTQNAVCSICRYEGTCLMVEHVYNNVASVTTALCKPCVDGIFIRSDLLNHIRFTCEKEERRIQKTK